MLALLTPNGSYFRIFCSSIFSMNFSEIEATLLLLATGGARPVTCWFSPSKSSWQCCNYNKWNCLKLGHYCFPSQAVVIFFALSGKLNPPLNRSLSSSTGTSSFSKEPPVLNRPRRSTICTSAEPVSSSTRSQSQSSQALKLPNGERAKIARLTPMKRAEITPIQPTPPKRMIDRPVSVGTSSSVKLQSRVKTRSNPPHHPTPNMAEKRVEHVDGENRQRFYF